MVLFNSSSYSLFGHSLNFIGRFRHRCRRRRHRARFHFYSWKNKCCCRTFTQHWKAVESHIVLLLLHTKMSVCLLPNGSAKPSKDSFRKIINLECVNCKKFRNKTNQIVLVVLRLLNQSTASFVLGMSIPMNFITWINFIWHILINSI